MRGGFEITSTITRHEAQLPINNKMRECTIYLNFFSRVLETSRIYFISVANSGETIIKRTQLSADD